MVSEIETIYNEGHANYSTRRFENAANSFKYLTSAAVANEEFEDTIYFFYREILAWKMTEHEDKLVDAWARLAMFSLKNTARVAIETANKVKDPEKRIPILQIAIDSLKIFGKQKDIEKAQNLLLKDLLLIARQVDLEFTDRILKYEKAIKVAIALKDKAKQIQIYEEFGDLYIGQAELKLNDPNFASEEVALKYFTTALEYFTQANNQKKIRQTKKRIQEIQQN
ncbi:MAG: hypothetical protein D6732_25545 [Methanobacteriota archaeon]|nr:MAG: hypothetical protein D6732_25545 [Euryarchaeota archaeon]